MDIEAITTTRLKQTLAAWQRAQPPPDDLLELTLLRELGGKSPAERQIYLRDWVYQLAQTQLQRQRQTESQPESQPETGDIPPTRQQLTAALAADFSHNNPRLEAWSALCHRYCLDVPITLEELAQAAAITPRHFSRRLQTGLSLLTDLVRREEMAAHGRYRAQRLRRHLPPPDYAQLFGGEPLLRQLTSLLQQEKGPRMISVEGLGGIGKTALARTLAGRLADIGNLEGIAWISARHE